LPNKSALSGNPEIIKYLIDNYGMNIKYKNNSRQDCQMYACKNSRNIEVIKYLIGEKKWVQ
jgi:hypothetical protein